MLKGVLAMGGREGSRVERSKGLKEVDSDEVGTSPNGIDHGLKSNNNNNNNNNNNSY